MSVNQVDPIEKMFGSLIEKVENLEKKIKLLEKKTDKKK